MAVDGYSNPLGEWEPGTTTYTLVTLTPSDPSRWLLSKVFSVSTRSRSEQLARSEGLKIRDTPAKQRTHGFNKEDLDYMRTSSIKLTSDRFPLEMRCEHVEGKDGAGKKGKGCRHGCYLLEKGGKENTWTCTSEHCEGHAYSGDVVAYKGSVKCFGHKGKRMVLLV